MLLPQKESLHRWWLFSPERFNMRERGNGSMKNNAEMTQRYVTKK